MRDFLKPTPLAPQERERLTKLCEDILDWSQDKDEFDDTFTEDILEKLRMGEDLTIPQVKGVENTHENCVMK